MKIGELAQRTGASARSLRHYESLGLVSSQRRPNGYRDYDEAAVHTVQTITSLLGLGFTTSVIAEVISCEDGGLPADCAALRSRVENLRDEMSARAAELVRRRDALTATLGVEATSGRRPRSAPTTAVIQE